ncbi:MAG TPA: ABC transporter ATP-binding protein [Bryobacteraceae bacterium]|nr:ABC transporter ATP-binding protein [Bryobacteraceae bacterium]
MSIPRGSTALALEAVSAGYGRGRVIADFTLTVERGELVALLGPSGSGKTTVLKLVAGLMAPDSGDILFDGKSVTGLPPEKRSAAMVFQKPLLFPYLNVRENVAFGLKMRKTPEAEMRERVGRALELVQLSGLETRRPGELSGGQEQRVSLARALVIEPNVLLLDEPFSALDQNLRMEMARLVRSVQRMLRITTLFVTHNQEEAAALADRAGLLLDGRLEQAGPTREFYTAPRTLRAARFFGWQALAGPGRRVIAFRQEHARLRPLGVEPAPETEFQRIVTVETAADLGTRMRYAVRTQSGETVEMEEPADGALYREGTRVTLMLREDLARVFET